MSLQTYLIAILTFLNDSIMPAMLAFAFCMFLWNATRYFIIGGANEENQQKARTLATWSILAFVFILSLWGIANLFVEGFGFGDKTPPTFDYIDSKKR